MAVSIRSEMSRGSALRLHLLVVATALAIGSFIAVAATDSLMVLVACLALGTVVVIFSMPKPKVLTDKAVWALVLTFFVLLCLYPSYVPIRLPGLPWINPIRIAATLMLFALLYLMAASRNAQAELKARIRAQPIYFVCFFGFVGATVLSLPTASDVSTSLGRFSVFQLYWTTFFLAAIVTLTTERRIETLLRLVIFVLAVQAALGLIESYRERSLWATILPANFGSDVEYFQRVIQGTFRFGVLRVQNSFSTSLLYAEFLVLLLPFALHVAFHGKTRIYRIIAALTALAVLPAQYASGSRLGTIGVIVVLSVYLGLFILKVYRSRRKTLMVPIIVVLAVTVGLVAVSAFLVSPRIQIRILGGSGHSASDEGRLEQYRIGIPMSIKRPLFGYGIGVGGETMNYTNLAGIASIDSYVLNLVLDVGYVGSLFFWGMIFWSIWSGARLYLRSETPTGDLGAAIATSLVAFVVIKIVLAQNDNMPLVFVMMALNLRLLQPTLGAGAVPAAPGLVGRAYVGRRRRLQMRGPQPAGLPDGGGPRALRRPPSTPIQS